KRLGGLLAPVVAGPVEGALRGVLALSRGPADVEPVDPDAVEAVGMRGVAGEAGQAGLGRDVGGQVCLAAVLGGRDDVDEGPGGAFMASPRRLGGRQAPGPAAQSPDAPVGTGRPKVAS